MKEGAFPSYFEFFFLYLIVLITVLEVIVPAHKGFPNIDRLRVLINYAWPGVSESVTDDTLFTNKESASFVLL